MDKSNLIDTVRDLYLSGAVKNQASYGVQYSACWRPGAESAQNNIC